MSLSTLLGDLRQEEIAADAAVLSVSPWPRDIKEPPATFGHPRQCPENELETWLRWLSLLVFLLVWCLFLASTEDWGARFLAAIFFSSKPML